MLHTASEWDLPRRAEAEDACAFADHTEPLTLAATLDPFVEQPNEAGLVATAVSWHPEGRTVYVAYGVQTCRGYCVASGLLCQWRVGDGSAGQVRIVPQRELRATSQLLSRSRVCWTATRL